MRPGQPKGPPNVATRRKWSETEGGASPERVARKLPGALPGVSYIEKYQRSALPACRKVGRADSGWMGGPSEVIGADPGAACSANPAGHPPA